MDTNLALTAICPYYTMFPLEFPLRVLRHARKGQWVADPFCGRGTTNFAARAMGLPSVGLDSSPIAVALARAKLCDSDPVTVVAVTRRLLAEAPDPKRIPAGNFWSNAYHPETLRTLCQLREALLKDC